MAVTIIVETGAGIADANSYVSIADITEWALTNPHDSTWASLIDANKNGYAAMACRILNEQMDWAGWQTDADQSLDLPRSGLTDKNGNSVDDDEIPDAVKNAQSELARLLAISDRTGDADTAGFKEIGVGSIKLVVDSADRPPTLPEAVFNMVRAFGTKAVSKGVSRVIRA